MTDPVVTAAKADVANATATVKADEAEAVTWFTKYKSVITHTLLAMASAYVGHKL